jgi:hypothetical protein
MNSALSVPNPFCLQPNVNELLSFEKQLITKARSK